MISFHLCYDLQYFNFYNFHITSNPFFLNYRLVIVNLFLFIVGISLVLANKSGLNWQKIGKRTLTLAAASFAISIVTFFIFPNTWVYFGVIHFILVASILALPFLKHPFIALLTSLILTLLYFSGYINMHPLFNTLMPILHLPKHHTEDLVPLVPWFSTVLLGVAFAAFGWHKIFDIKSNYLIEKLAYIGKHALLIYLIHQPILFAILYLIRFF